MRTPRLVALDMDGTLLDGSGALPPRWPEVAARAEAAGMILAPASGRQLATLRAMFPDRDTFLAENGTVIMHKGQVVSTTEIAPADVAEILDAADTLTVAHTLLLCTPETAYVVPASLDEAAQAELEKYYKSVTYIKDLRAVTDPVIKVAVFCGRGSEKHIYPTFASTVGHLGVAVSGQVWLDIMSPDGNKGAGLRQLADATGVAVADTAAFGDFLNDYELLEAAGYAVAMENAHPRLKEIADRIAPPNTEYGVLTVLEEWLGA